MLRNRQFWRMEISLDFKIEVHKHCVELIGAKIRTIETELKKLQESANQETKSTAGDKYETARAMVMIEKENLSKQQGQLVKQFQLLNNLKLDSKHQVDLGSLVKCGDGKVYFLSIGLGIIDFQGYTIIAISPVAPIGKLMMNKTSGDSFVFNKNQVSIDLVV